VEELENVEQFPDINKLSKVASCWIYFRIYAFDSNLRLYNCAKVNQKYESKLLLLLFYFNLLHLQA
jgi:hypothetical protein